MKIKILFIAFICFFVLTACDLNNMSGYNYLNDNGFDSPAEQKNDLFTNQEDNSDIYTFVTNNTQYKKRTGYTLWCEKYTNSSDNFETVKCNLKKLSGDSKAGYGVVFCSTKKANNKTYLLVVMINNIQEYNIGKLDDGKFTSISNGWIQTNKLYPGSSSFSNTIEINYITEGEQINKFELKLNDYVVNYFSDKDNTTPVFTNTNSGYVVCISPYENFFTSNVNVQFKKLN